MAAPLSDRTDHVISFPALALKNWNLHGPQNVLHDRHLHSKFIRHGMARSLVSVVLQMAECRCLEIERDAERVWLFLCAEFLKNIQKPVNCVSKEPILGCQCADTVIGTVNDAVSIENHQLHGRKLLCISVFSLSHFCLSFKKGASQVDGFLKKHYTE